MSKSTAVIIFFTLICVENSVQNVKSILISKAGCNKIKAVGVMLPIRLHCGAFRAVVLGGHRSFYLPSPMIRLTLSRSSSRVSHFSISSKIARRSASLTFKSIHLIPFCKRFHLCLTRILSSVFAEKSTGVITKYAKEKRPIRERKMLKDGPLLD